MTSLAIQLRLPRSERHMCSTLKEEDKNAQGQVSPLSEETWSSKGSSFLPLPAAAHPYKDTRLFLQGCFRTLLENF